MTSVQDHSLVFVHAHPDDESITTGGTIARYSAEGVRVGVVTCTLGEEGEIIPAEKRELASDAGDQLGGYRAAELSAAGAVLGWSSHRYLGGIGRWRDSGMAGTPSAEHPRAFVQGDLAEQTQQLVQLLEELRPRVVVTYDAAGGYGHPDHIRAHDITMAAVDRVASVQRVFYTVPSAAATRRGLARLRTVGEIPFRIAADDELPTTPDEEITTTVDVRSCLPAKFAALRAHETQISVGTEYFALSNDIAQPVPDTESFVLVRGSQSGAETDLFGGIRP